jgi:predicted O-methyltransferase YrrM
LDLFFSVLERVKHFFKAKGANGIHSPFVFEFYYQVLNHPYNFYAFSQIEDERDRLLDLDTVLEYQDLGAKKQIVKTRISKLTSKSLMPEEKDVFLFQLCHWLKPNVVLELGTCLGITSAYLAKAYPSKVYTFEGIQAIADEAHRVWDNLQIFNIELIEGPIENTLPQFLIGLKTPIDIAIIDANHSFNATINNFEMLLPNMAEQGCIVLDDIYWSKEMTLAWQEITKRPEVTVSIDLFHLGLVFFRKESRKEHFNIHW